MFTASGYTAPQLIGSDGTAGGTVVLSNSSGGVRGSVAAGGNVYFVTEESNGGIGGPTDTLWQTDGTAVGTKAFVTLPAGVHVSAFSPDGSWLAEAGGKAYFAASSGGSGTELWVSDGTAAGTKMLKEINTSTQNGFDPSSSPYPRSSFPQQFTVVGNRVYFVADDGVHGQELWATDGTPAGTAVVSVVGSQSSAWDRAFAGPLPVGVVNGRALFSADDGSSGRQLWATDGTAAGTNLLNRLNTTDLGSDPQSFLTLGSRVLFTATDGHGAYSVFATDGTAAPTLVKRFEAGTDLTAMAKPGSLVRSGGLAYFTLNAGTNGRQLWASDGTPAGTKLLKKVTLPADLSPTGNNPLGLANLTDVNGKLFFTVDLSGVGQQLWKTDGTPAGTGLVKQVNADSSSVNGFVPPTVGPLRRLTASGGKLFFAADTDASSGQVWVSDGTAAGTKVVKALGVPATPTNPYPAGANPAVVAVVGNQVLIAADLQRDPDGGGGERAAGVCRVLLIDRGGAVGCPARRPRHHHLAGGAADDRWRGCGGGVRGERPGGGGVPRQPGHRHFARRRELLGDDQLG